MGLFDKLFGGTKRESATAVIEAPPCPHVVLVPRWDAAGDIGNYDKASRFVCESCDREFTPQEAQDLQSSTAARLPEQVEEKSVEEMANNK